MFDKKAANDPKLVEDWNTSTFFLFKFKISFLFKSFNQTAENKEVFLEITYLEHCDVISAHETEMVLDYAKSLEELNNDKILHKKQIETERLLKIEEDKIKEENTLLTQ